MIPSTHIIPHFCLSAGPSASRFGQPSGWVTLFESLCLLRVLLLISHSAVFLLSIISLNSCWQSPPLQSFEGITSLAPQKHYAATWSPSCQYFLRMTLRHFGATPVLPTEVVFSFQKNFNNIKSLLCRSSNVVKHWCQTLHHPQFCHTWLHLPWVTASKEKVRWADSQKRKLACATVGSKWIKK